MTRVIGALVAGGVVSVWSIAAITATPVQDISSDCAALRAFDERVAAYGALHRGLEASLPPLGPSAEPELIVTHRKQLVAAIKAARPKARQGNFFTVAAARVFRGLIDDAFSGHDVEHLLRDLFAEHPKTWGHRVKVYDSYPSWATREVPAPLLQRLPVLPKELEYRVVDHDLAILDAGANLVLDVLPAAIASSRHEDSPTIRNSPRSPRWSALVRPASCSETRGWTPVRSLLLTTAAVHQRWRIRR